MILFFDETGHFTCSQNRTFSLATDNEESAVTRSELSAQRRLAGFGSFHRKLNLPDRKTKAHREGA
jgi:hypothetical protein